MESKCPSFEELLNEFEQSKHFMDELRRDELYSGWATRVEIENAGLLSFLGGESEST
jgi:hypothetical protein